MGNSVNLTAPCLSPRRSSELPQIHGAVAIIIWHRSLCRPLPVVGRTAHGQPSTHAFGVQSRQARVLPALPSRACVRARAASRPGGMAPPRTPAPVDLAHTAIPTTRARGPLQARVRVAGGPAGGLRDWSQPVRS